MEFTTQDRWKLLKKEPKMGWKTRCCSSGLPAPTLASVCAHRAFIQHSTISYYVSWPLALKPLIGKHQKQSSNQTEIMSTQLKKIRQFTMSAEHVECRCRLNTCNGWNRRDSVNILFYLMGINRLLTMVNYISGTHMELKTKLSRAPYFSIIEYIWTK